MFSPDWSVKTSCCGLLVPSFDCSTSAKHDSKVLGLHQVQGFVLDVLHKLQAVWRSWEPLVLQLQCNLHQPHLRSKRLSGRLTHLTCQIAHI